MKRINSLVSFGTSILKPGQLQTRATSEVLDGIRDGVWRPQVALVRRLYGSGAYEDAIRQLPFVTWSGAFAHRDSNGLIQHSGQMGIDVDDLTPKQCLKTISRAVLDRYCLAAFHSVSGRRVRLVIRVPTTLDRFTHPVAFRQVAARVRNFCHVEPDKGGSDVARACFVSFDKTMVINLSAEIFPVELPISAPIDTRSVSSLARKEPRRIIAAPSTPARVPGKLNLGDIGAFHLGGYFAPHGVKPDGTYYTHHQSLFQLGKRITMIIHKQALTEEDQNRLMDEVFAGWIAMVQRSKHRLRGEDRKYRQELSKIVRSSLKRPGIKKAATTWTRWTLHSEFPSKGGPEERLLFAIRNHCKAKRSKVFYIGCRDTALVAGVKSTRTSAKLLQDLRRKKILSVSLDGKYVPPRANRRHARRYRLLS